MIPLVLGGSITALATPFLQDGILVDEDAFADLVTRQERAGTTAVVCCGSTGEAALLSRPEHRAVVATAVAARTRMPIIAGCSASATREAIMLATAAARAGADALLLSAPPYIKPSQESIAAHVRVVAEATGLPIVLYDIPGRTGVAISDATVAALFEQGSIVALKDSSGDLARVSRLLALCGPALIQLSGEDAIAAGYRAMGGAGCVSVTSNVVPRLCAALHAAWDRGDTIEMGRLRDALAPLHEALFAESNPVPVKAALAAAGLCHAAVRLPLLAASAMTMARLEPILAALLPMEAHIARPALALVNQC